MKKPNKNHICRPQAKADKPAPKPEPAPNDEDTLSPSGSVPTTPPNKGHSSSKTRTRFLYAQEERPPGRRFDGRKRKRGGKKKNKAKGNKKKKRNEGASAEG